MGLDITEAVKERCERLFPGRDSSLAETDPEFVERFCDFAFDEVVNEEGAHELLDDRTRHLAVLATLLGCQGVDLFRVMLPAALEAGVTPVEAKETVYQAVDYLGLGRVYPFLQVTNEVLQERGVELPLPGQATTTRETRLEAGAQTQVDIFGEGMRDFWKKGPADYPHINRWLAANCFGDWYTRTGLTNAEREMVTFCYIAAQGGCEPQLTSHAAGNMLVGNSKAFLIQVVSQCLPYIGYPRSLNALGCIMKAAE